MAKSSMGSEAISLICVTFILPIPMAIITVLACLIKREGMDTSSNDTPEKNFCPLTNHKFKIICVFKHGEASS